MEREKRKREDNDVMEEKRRTKGEDVNAAAGGKQTQKVSEDEVEEFYAILRRIHVAVKYFEKVNNNKEGRSKLTDTTWRPSFQAEDFDEHNGVTSTNNNGGQTEKGVEEDSGFDLNSDPSSS